LPKVTPLAKPLASPSISIRHSHSHYHCSSRCRFQLPCFSAGYQKEKGIAIGACLWPKMLQPATKTTTTLCGPCAFWAKPKPKTRPTATALGISNCLCLPPPPLFFFCTERNIIYNIWIFLVSFYI